MRRTSHRMPIVLGTFTSSSTKFVDLSYHAETLWKCFSHWLPRMHDEAHQYVLGGKLDNLSCCTVVSKLPSFIRFRHIFLVKWSFLSFLFPSCYPYPNCLIYFLALIGDTKGNLCYLYEELFFIIHRHSLNINFFYLLSLRQFYIISLSRYEKAGWPQSLQDALCGWLPYLVLAHWLLAEYASSRLIPPRYGDLRRTFCFDNNSTVLPVSQNCRASWS